MLLGLFSRVKIKIASRVLFHQVSFSQRLKYVLFLACCFNRMITLNFWSTKNRKRVRKNSKTHSRNRKRNIRLVQYKIYIVHSIHSNMYSKLYVLTNFVLCILITVCPNTENPNFFSKYHKIRPCKKWRESRSILIKYTTETFNAEIILIEILRLERLCFSH